jgi:superfamily I DNA/RNA helicase/RecB family exonuclease
VTITGFSREQTSRARVGREALDASQHAVVDLPDGASAAVLGAPGTGKTTTLVELLADRVLDRGWGADAVLALTTSRASATRLRDAIALRLGVPTTGAMARSVNSFAFEIVGEAARAAGARPPRLVTGSDQDADIAALLEGHLEDGAGPDWPTTLGPDVRRTRRFRSELRELLTRATEFGVTPSDLRRRAAERARPDWRASADFFEEYAQVISASREHQLDQAELAQFAARAIDDRVAGSRVDSLRLVLVDDFQEATEAGFALLRALARRGISVIAFGDPDVAASSFRGAEPDVLPRLADVLRIPDATVLVLETAHRQGHELRAFTSLVTERIGTAAAGRQRAAVAIRENPPASLAHIEARTPSREWAAIARELRERHLVHGVPWDELAVVVRSGAQVESARRALAQAEVPVTAATGGLALRDHSAARALLAVVEVGTGRRELSPAVASDLLLGPFGGLDRLGLRKLRLALRAEELGGGGTLSADELLVDALSAPGRLATIDHRVGRNADRLATTLGLVRASDGSIEELLWIVWSRSGLARIWHDEALDAGPGADEANRRLDGIVALFSAAKRYTERKPLAEPTGFLAEVLDADVPEDTLSPHSSGESVTVATPSALVGLEFDTVVVAGLQEGVWPNMRLRGSLLAPQLLVREVLGIDSATLNERRIVRDDELRMFALAVSRARERLVLAAVANDDEAPSPLFLLAESRSVALDVTGPPPLSLRGMVGRLRRTMVDDRVSAEERAAAASTLAALAAERVPGADPAEWHGVLEISTTRPLYEGQPVPVRPSSIDKVEKSALDWFLESVARSDPGIAANVGTLLHSALENATSSDVDGLWATVEERWGELSFESSWLEERQKRQLWRFSLALSEYLEDFDSSGSTAVAAEGRFSLQIGAAEVRGSIDRVEVSPSGAVAIIDLKTGSPIPKKDIAEFPQLAVYQLAYAEGSLDEYLLSVGNHRAGGATLLFVKRGGGGKKYSLAHQPPFTAEQLAEFRERVQVAASIVAQAQFQGVADVIGPFESHALLRLHRVTAVTGE